ncbi:hypothetical protein [Agrobacterium bohemicum]|uniref:hypothetical protein n=1 Tax=Agrobacterium bohemicum TaxID=2052828 RepID=UPI001319D811|nr:hypothetical protein [Agrobacterium bohemicum]
MKLKGKTYHDLMMDIALQQHFLKQYDRLIIQPLKQAGYLEAALIHAGLRKRIITEFELLN